MDPELKAKWVAALRSGEYRQETGRLRKGDAYCCLGVLCEVAGMSLLGAERQGLELGPYQLRKAGLSMTQMIELSTRNDGVGGLAQHSFPQIADWIEANL